MLPTICQCCGLLIQTRAAANPNICFVCAEADFRAELEPNQPPPMPRSTTSIAAHGHPIELEHLLALEEPSVLECLEALEQAEQAIAEKTAEETQQPPAPAAVPAPTGVPSASAAVK